ncbi:MAG: phospho-sugar mutase, partial [Actinomycetota bacterium]|nr:phospho-sugar mutase [Actinomycetota bacterium]
MGMAGAWADADPHDGDRAEIEALIAAGDVEELRRRFAGPLTFGTAGLRGPLRAGPAGMNATVVTRAAAGLARYLIDQGHGGGTVVIGFDARRRSDEFARTSASVFAAAGFVVQVMPRPLPTPVLAFAVRHLGAVVGVMVTASHNPPDDNGYKVYLGDGAQLVPPADRRIEEAISAVGPAREVVLAGGYGILGEDVLTEYVASVVRALDPERVPAADRVALR